MDIHLLAELRDSLRARDLPRLRRLVRNWPASNLARILARLDDEDQAIAFRVLPRERAAQAFAYLDLQQQERLLKNLAQEEVAGLLNALADDDRTTLFEELPAAATKRLLEVLDEKERRSALQLLGYPAGSVGRLMTPHYIAVRSDWTPSKMGCFY